MTLNVEEKLRNAKVRIEGLKEKSVAIKTNNERTIKEYKKLQDRIPEMIEKFSGTYPEIAEYLGNINHERLTTEPGYNRVIYDELKRLIEVRTEELLETISKEEGKLK